MTPFTAVSLYPENKLKLPLQDTAAADLDDQEPAQVSRFLYRIANIPVQSILL